MSLLTDLHELCDSLAAELGKVNTKMKSGNGSITASDLDYVDKLTHSIKSIKTTTAMLEASDGNENYWKSYYDSRSTSHLAHGNQNGYVPPIPNSNDRSEVRYRLEQIAMDTRDPIIRRDIEQLMTRI